MKSGKRSPTAHRTLEQAQKHGVGYGGTKKRKKYRADLNALPDAPKGQDNAHKKSPKGQDNAHKKSFSKGGKTTKSNVKPGNRSKNRAHGMTRGKKANRGK
jgi:hypothetical protein